jgi:hypothetical protein
LGGRCGGGPDTILPVTESERDRLAECARHAVYGSVIVLAVIVALDGTGVRSREVIASVLGAAIATVLAEIYADYLAATIRWGRRPTGAERAERLRNAAVGLIAAVLPVIFFLFSALGTITLEAAFAAATWTGVGVVGFYAFVANRRSGMGIGMSLAVGAGFAALGAVLVLVKALASH